MIDYKKFKVEMKISKCIISFENKIFEITDAKLQCENSYWYICQNVIAGESCRYKLGYKYSWNIGKDGSEYYVKEQLKELILFSLKDKINILKKELCK
jgi:hypothetical protein